MSSPASDDESMPDDSDFRQQLLQKLADFGDSLLDEDDFAERKRKAAKRKSQSSKCCTSVQSNDNGAMSDSKRHKLKKKKKKLLPEPAETNIQTNGQRNGLHGEQKYLQQLCTELGLTNNGTKQLEKQKPHEQPKTYSIQQCTKRGVTSAAEPNVIVFQEPCRSKKKAMLILLIIIQPLDIQKEGEQPQEIVGQPEITLKHARFDVRKFGIKGMAEADKEGATVAMLMQLGAKAPKKKCINYRVLLETKKKTAEEEKLKSETVMMYSRNHEIPFSLLIRPSVKKDRNAIGYIDGQVGRYKGGVQHVNPSDLSAGKRKKRK
ncbi:hypothetical protein NP493_499g01006 [Ridgeia piscesae]|uniref:Uncharacterized protein n=1 Tax=Ridgeia piscesae TaxID=27915 RepID=A0AAD9KXS7_RIDPI|nr:hypothetical protein NP493_499g01006 [Ridgeia piscesae]